VVNKFVTPVNPAETKNNKNTILLTKMLEKEDQTVNLNAEKTHEKKF